MTQVIKTGKTIVLAVAQQGPPGPPGPQGSNEGLATRNNFSWGDATPAVLTTILTGISLFRIDFNITIPFTGTAPTVKIGTFAEPEKFVATTDIDLSSTGTYVFHPLFTPQVDTPIYIRITPDVDTDNGAGFLLLYTS